MQPQHLIDGFLAETGDQLAQIEEIVLDLNGSAPDAGTVNTLFRAFHTIKGSAGMFGFDAISGFTHHVENVLDQVRGGNVAATPELLETVLEAGDHIRRLLAAPSGTGLPASAGEALIERLAELSQAGPAPASPPEMAPRRWHVGFRPNPGLLASGGNPILILNELKSLGECRVQCRTADVPPLSSLEPDTCYLSWTAELTTAASEETLRDVFLFVEDGSDIEIRELAPEARSPAAPAAAAPAPASLPESAAQPRRSQLAQGSVRVPSHKLDQLVNLVGELVMNQSRLTQAASKSDDPSLAAPVEEVERLVAELRDSVLGIRMMPISTTFTRFKRLVHDLSAELGKQIDLVTEGGETELDKTVLDQLGDPLVHLIRNSIDHGIETVEDRERAGKPPRGVIRLTAVHTGSNVVVRIQDDGKGLNAEAIRAKAIEKGLIAPDAALADKEILNLIFLPGFSTARQVTSISGRGVGMDVVRRQIEAVSGSVSINSQAGAGTTISLTLPLTLAIIDGLLVEVAGHRYIVPMSLVTENVELHRAERSRNNGRNVVAVRGELVPYVSLRDAFSTGGVRPDIEKIVIVRHDDQRVGLVVDRVVGSHQTVIQSLGRFYRNVEAFSGATIMGDGRVALIVEIAGLVRSLDHAPHAHAA